MESADNLFGNPDSVAKSDSDQLERQNARLVDDFRARKFEREAKKHWDLFYKRNADRFFKDRHWTTREFKDLIPESAPENERRVLVEFGCGVGNFAFPLLAGEEGEDGGSDHSPFFIYACDFSPRAVDIVKAHPLYRPENISAFTLDITTSPETAFDGTPLRHGAADVASLMFVLSALKPEDFRPALENVRNSLKSGGVLIMRDYAVNDMAMLRFGPGTKIKDRHYVRQDGTMSYFFTLEEVEALAGELGLTTRTLEYVQRRTVNKKEGVDVPRVFIQGVFVKT